MLALATPGLTFAAARGLGEIVVAAPPPAEAELRGTDEQQRREGESRLHG